MKNINLRKGKLNDAKLVLSLRNEKIARRMSVINQNIIPLSHHLKWFSKHWKEYKIIKYGKKDIGYLRTDASNFISICLFPEYRNRDIGSKILKTAKGYATIRMENKVSLNCFLKGGFKLIGFYLEGK